jgi:hypothetical protein
LATGARLAETVSGNMIKSFGLTYATVQLSLPPIQALGALLATAGVERWPASSRQRFAVVKWSLCRLML